MTISLWYRLKSGCLIPPAPFFFFKIALDIQGLLCFHTNFIFLVLVLWKMPSYFDKVCIEYVDFLGSIVILTILILPIQEHGISFYLILQSLIFFICVLQYSEYKFSASLGRFTPRYFILFDVMVNKIVSLISLSGLLLLVYRNARDFCCILQLYLIH